MDYLQNSGAGGHLRGSSSSSCVNGTEISCTAKAASEAGEKRTSAVI